MMRTIYRILFLTPLVVLLAVGAVSARDSQWPNDPGKLGQYAVGHTSYRFVNTAAPGPKGTTGRPEFISVWYPVNAEDIHNPPTLAQYLTDPYADLTYTGPGSGSDPTFVSGWPPTTSTSSADWEAIGYDRAYEGLGPSHDGPFPLLMVSPDLGGNYWFYIFIGTRLASHGYVVAVMEHWADGQWYGYRPQDDFLTVMFNRTRDVSFAITQLFDKSTPPGKLLSGAIDPQRIAASGNGVGGYVAYTLAGGDDLVCDALWPTGPISPNLYLNVISPYPANTCVSIPPDPRIKAIISLDGFSQLHRYSELARISVPSLIMGETVDLIQGYSGSPPMRANSARPHAAINRDDSYRVDINGANHLSFSDICDGGQVFLNVGQFTADDFAWWEGGWPCTADWWNPVSISSPVARAVVTKYMIAFLDIYLGGPQKNKTLDWQILTPEYAITHTPAVQFFESEGCKADLPDNSYFSYRPYQLYIECDVAQKDPDGWFGSPSASGNAAQVLRAPAQVGPLQHLRKPF